MDAFSLGVMQNYFRTQYAYKAQDSYRCYIAYKATSILFCFQYKIWLKPSAEQQFLYGHHVLKSGLGRITENTPKYQGVVVLSMNDLPLVSEWLKSFCNQSSDGVCICIPFADS